jgi:hypothetical protein
MNRYGAGASLALVLAVACAAVVGCGDSTRPTDGPSLIDATGDGQAGVAGLSLPQQLSVRYVDDHGRGVAGAPIVWSVLGGGGRLANVAASTDSTGVTRASWELGASEGAQQIRVTAPGNQQRVFTATASTLHASNISSQSFGCILDGLGAVSCADPVSKKLYPVPAPAPFVKLAAVFSGTRLCGISAAAQVYCGAFSVSAPYDPQASPTIQPATLVPGLPPVASVGFGTRFQCALTNAGEAWCWGTSDNGGLGGGTLSETRAVPGPVSGGHLFTQMSAAKEFACGLDGSGIVWCWGSLPGKTARITPVPIQIDAAGGWSRLVVGAGMACVLDSQGRAYCFGDNLSGELGTGDFVPSDALVPAAGGQRFSQLLGFDEVVVGIDAAGRATAWGNVPGAIDGAMPIPVPLGNPEPIVQASGCNGICGLTASGAVYKWYYDSQQNTVRTIGFPSQRAAATRQ